MSMRSRREVVNGWCGSISEGGRPIPAQAGGRALFGVRLRTQMRDQGAQRQPARSARAASWRRATGVRRAGRPGGRGDLEAGGLSLRHASGRDDAVVASGVRGAAGAAGGGATRARPARQPRHAGSALGKAPRPPAHAPRGGRNPDACCAPRFRSAAKAEKWTDPVGWRPTPSSTGARVPKAITCARSPTPTFSAAGSNRRPS